MKAGVIAYENKATQYCMDHNRSTKRKYDGLRQQFLRENAKHGFFGETWCPVY